jgi:Cu/Zn superoxide dismutase
MVSIVLPILGGGIVRAVWVPLAGAFALAVTTAVAWPAQTEAQQSVTINLSAQNDSGQTGTAVLTPDGSGTKVVLTLSNAPGPHPAHIHAGSCPTPGAVVFPLTTVTNGKSETTVAASIADILRAPHAVNVHKSPQEIPVYTACGNVTAAAAAAPAAPPAAAPAAPKPAAPAAAAAPAAQPSPAAKPAAPAPAPAAAPAQAPAAKPAAAAAPMAAPAQAPRPAPSPAALPRTGEVDPTAGLWMVAAAGIGLVGAGAFLIARRRRSI